MILKTIAVVTAGVMLMGSSRAIPAPIYLHCTAPTVQMEQKACKALVKNLRARKLSRSVAMLSNSSDRAGVGVHITLHLSEAENSELQGYLSWGNAGNQALDTQDKGPSMTVSMPTQQVRFQKSLDSLLDLSKSPI